MFKQWIKQFIAMILVIFTISSSILPVYADDYVANESSTGDATYYILEGKSVDSLFEFSIYDVKNLIPWIIQFRTFTVTKKYVNEDGNAEYKMYFNTPNLQALAKNMVLSFIDDGYTDNTYDVNETEWIVKVGKNATSENVITNYGFKIPNYDYNGEYPKEEMTVAGVLPSPKKWWQVLWRAIKAVYGGASFIKAPTSDNFNTISYLNHTYLDNDDYIINFFQKYYLDYFERQIPIGFVNSDNPETYKYKNKDLFGDDYYHYRNGPYFNSPEEVIQMAVTEDMYNSAKQYNADNQDTNNEAVARNEYLETYLSEGVESMATSTVTVGNREYDGYHFICSTEEYKNRFNNWIRENPTVAFLLAKAAHYPLNEEGTVWPQRYSSLDTGRTTMKYLSDYGFRNGIYYENINYDTSISLAADLMRYLPDSEVFHAEIAYDIETRSKTDTYNVTSGGQVSSGTFSNWIRTETEHKEYVPFHDTKYWRDNPSYSQTYTDHDYNTYSESDSYTNPTTGYITTTTTTYKDDTTIETRKINFRILKLYPLDSVYLTANGEKGTTTDETIANGDANYITYSQFKTWENSLSVKALSFDDNEIMTDTMSTVMTQYSANEELIQQYIEFCERLNRGDPPDTDDSIKEIYYRQCMITNEGKDDECWSRQYSDDKTSLTVAHVYAFSGLYEITAEYLPTTHELKKEDAHAILNKLQEYCGPYYTQVLSNMMCLMAATAKYEGNIEPTRKIVSDDPRIMPYDTTTLLFVDQEHYNIADPRVQRYKEHVVGKIASSATVINIGLTVSSLPAYLIEEVVRREISTFYKNLISISGTITEISVFLQQLCNFDILDDYGLSPTNLWTNGYAALLLAFLAIFFIVKTVISIIKMGVSAGKRIVAAFFLLVFELGVVTAISYNPSGIWNNVKNIENNLINLGEMSTMYSFTDLSYLYGNPVDQEVTYYIPYLDAWSTFNTGYGILDSQQVINATNDKRELIKKDFPKIGSTEVKHWSVLLADSFSYHGYDGSANAIYENGKSINGTEINNNAYRVVDHFMAPRVTVSDNVTTLDFNITQNENYNGLYQKGNFNIFLKLLICIFCCLLSIIKFCTFLWQWFVFYILIFNVILGKVAERKTTTQILVETFAPTLGMILIGMYCGIMMPILMSLNGFIGLVFIIFAYVLTFKVFIKGWHNFNNGAYFPKTLAWLYWITSLVDAKRNMHANKLRNESAYAAELAGDLPNYYANMTISEQRELLFNTDGTLKAEYNTERYERTVYLWQDRVARTLGTNDPDNLRDNKDVMLSYNNLINNEEKQEKFNKFKPKDKDKKDIQQPTNEDEAKNSEEDKQNQKET